MKTIGLIGGMSWESTAVYYQLLNQGVNARLGGLHSVNCLLYSLDFQAIETLQRQGNWLAAGEQLAIAAEKLQRSGAECILVCSNTMHKVIDAVTAGITIPLIHIADVTVKAVLHAGVKRVALLGTRFTMEEKFFIDRLQENSGLQVSVPLAEEREMIDRVIFSELCHGKVLPSSMQQYADVVKRMADEGVEGVVLGCTEIGMLLKPADVVMPLFDTTSIHVDAALDWALAKG